MKKIFLLWSCFFVTPLFASGIGSGATSAPCDNATLETYTGTANMEINWEPNVIDLKWYNGDTQISGPTTCTYNGSLSVPATPTKTGYTFIGWELRKIGVPNSFTELEYVHFDGTTTTGAYIDTGLKFYTNILNTNVKFVADAKLYSGNDWQVIIGNHGYYSAYVGSNKVNLLYYGFGGNDTSTGFYNQYERYIHDFDLIAGTYKIKKVSDNTQIVNISGINPVSKNYSIPIYLGGFTDNPTQGSGMRSARTKMDLYSVKIYNNDELVFNGIPARRNSDNVVGIYDTISGTFKINATGTNALTAGPVVQ